MCGGLNQAERTEMGNVCWATGNHTWEINVHTIKLWVRFNIYSFT